MNETTTTTRTLIDAETGADLGPATVEQCEASDRTAEGLILIVEDGTVVSEGSWEHQNGQTRRVWVTEA